LGNLLPVVVFVGRGVKGHMPPRLVGSAGCPYYSHRNYDLPACAHADTKLTS